MTIDLFPVLRFLTDHARSEALLPDAWAFVRAVSTFATSPAAPASAHPDDAMALSDAVAFVTGRQVKRVAVVPSACAMPSVAYMTPDAYVSPFRNGMTLPEERLDRETGKALYVLVRDSFADLIEVAVGARLAGGPWAAFASSIAEDMVDALYGFLSHVIADDAVGALRHRHYLETAMITFVVGEIADKPGIWVALAA